MPDPFDGYQFLNHLRARWRVPVVALVAAVVVSLAISLLLPKKYTARATLVIEPPPGSDPRAATTVSPVYLESLKTYEHFATSDQLFAQAVTRFDLRGGWPNRSIESLKRSVLQVSIPRNTKVLEIAATLPDASKAHAVALYLADETIKLNRKTGRVGDEELIAETRRRVEQSAQRLREAQTARNAATQRSPTPEALTAELEQLRALREEVERLTISAELSVEERGKGRAESLRRRRAELDGQVDAKQQLLARRTAEIESLTTAHDSAWTAHEELERHLRGVEAASGTRGERLNLLDPGVVPERPSFPDVPLNLLVAAALALVASFLFLTLEFTFQAQKAESLRKGLRVASKS